MNRAGLSTQPCRGPVCMIGMEDVRLPILTVCGLFVRSIIHEQSVMDNPRLSLFTSLWGTMVLKLHFNSPMT